MPRFDGGVSGGVGSITVAAFGSTPNAGGASAAGLTLTNQPADAANPGGVSITAQTFAGAKTFAALVASTVASGSDAFKLLDGARLNFSTADASAYLYRSAANVLTTPGSMGAASLDLSGVVALNLATNGRIVFGGGNYITHIGATGQVTASAGWDAGTASGGNAYQSVDGARWNLSTADASAYLARNAANVINTPGKLTATAGLGVGNSAVATIGVGLLARKMEVFDATGTSLGFVPIYDAIT